MTLATFRIAAVKSRHLLYQRFAQRTFKGHSQSSLEWDVDEGPTTKAVLCRR